MRKDTIINLIFHPIRSKRDMKNALDFRSTYTEVVIEDQYGWLFNKLRPNTTIVDIGAHLGDTAFYFARSSNVKQIVAYEPTKRLYDEAVSFSRLSPFKNKIRFYNMAITHDGKSPTTAYDDGNKSPGVQLSVVLNGLQNVVIKSDCEGEERFLFKNVDLNNVYAMQIEIHGNCGDEVVRDLEKSGFKPERRTLQGLHSVEMVLATRS